MSKKMSPASLANLEAKKIKKGEVRSPNGRAGKDGTGGLTWKNAYKKWLAKNLERDPDFQEAPFYGLYRKASEGDVKCMDRLREMNDEVVNDVVKVEGFQLPNVTINIVEPETPKES